MKSKTIQVVVEFKEVPMNLYYETDNLLDSNLLVINIQPNEGISLHLNAKRTFKELILSRAIIIRNECPR